jgi:hypothetical protein
MFKHKQEFAIKIEVMLMKCGKQLHYVKSP